MENLRESNFVKYETFIVHLTASEFEENGVALLDQYLNQLSKQNYEIVSVLGPRWCRVYDKEKSWFKDYKYVWEYQIVTRKI